MTSARDATLDKEIEGKISWIFSFSWLFHQWFLLAEPIRNQLMGKCNLEESPSYDIEQSKAHVGRRMNWKSSRQTIGSLLFWKFMMMCLDVGLFKSLCWALCLLFLEFWSWMLVLLSQFFNFLLFSNSAFFFYFLRHCLNFLFQPIEFKISAIIF